MYLFNKKVRKFISFVQEWSSASINRKIFNMTLLNVLATIFSKGFVMVKDLMVARTFGLSDALDAFLMSFAVISFVTNVLVTSLNASLVPMIVSVRDQKGRSEANHLLQSILTANIFFLLCLTFILLIGAPYWLPYLAGGFTREKLLFAQELLYIMGIEILLNGVAAVYKAALNAYREFIIPSLSAILTPLSMIIFLIIGSNSGALALALGTLVGAFLELGMLGWAMVTKDLPLLPLWARFSPQIQGFINQYYPMIIGTIIMSGTDIVDRSMASMLGSGSVSALNFGTRLVNIPITLVVFAFGTVVLHYVSRMVAKSDWQGLRHTLKNYLFIIFICSMPVSLLLFFYSEPIVRIVFERGAFTSSDTKLVAVIQAYYGLQIPFFAASVLIARIISALQNNRVLMWVAVMNFVLKIILNLIFIEQWGVAGITLSTSVLYGAYFIVLLFIVLQAIRRNEVKRNMYEQ
jgi:putative peptidoglycan lipid II flippase